METETFDIYCFGATDSEAFFLQPIELGTSVWLDGVDGFFDQYFDGRESDEQICFLAVRDQDALRTALVQHTLGQLPIIDAALGINTFTLGAEVKIRQVQRFQAWLETRSLSPVVQLSHLSLGDPFPFDVLTSLINEVIQTGQAHWLRPRPRWQPGVAFRSWQAAQPPEYLNGIVGFKYDAIARCVVVNDYSHQSVVFDIPASGLAEV